MIYITALVLHNNTKEVSGGYKGRGPRIEPLLEDQGTRMGTYILNHHFMKPYFLWLNPTLKVTEVTPFPLISFIHCVKIQTLWKLNIKSLNNILAMKENVLSISCVWL